jgi:hypothetical protein
VRINLFLFSCKGKIFDGFAAKMHSSSSVGCGCKAVKHEYVSIRVSTIYLKDKINKRHKTEKEREDNERKKEREGKREKERNGKRERDRER